MNRKDEKDNQNLIEFWNKAYELSEEDKRQISGNGSDGWRSMAPSEKLYVDGVLRLVSLSDDEWTALFSRHFKVIRLEHFAWPGEKSETRRLFHLER